MSSSVPSARRVLLSSRIQEARKGVQEAIVHIAIGLIISYGAVQRDGQRSGSSSDFGLSGFLRRTVEDTIESHEIHILSALRHHEHKYDDKVEMIGTLNFHMSTV
ncbi:hypothetical protein JHK85_022680 [Glycine max]|nr:hypothetical protein JHK85_022680 [Glycine max]KAG5026305.1 hypothetical protein JHK86_022219 [Glycine max]